MTKYQSSIDGLQRILDEYPGTQHGFDYAFLSEEESKTIIREARDTLIALKAWKSAVMMSGWPAVNVYTEPRKPTSLGKDHPLLNVDKSKL